MSFWMNQMISKAPSPALENTTKPYKTLNPSLLPPHNTRKPSKTHPPLQNRSTPPVPPLISLTWANQVHPLLGVSAPCAPENPSLPQQRRDRLPLLTQSFYCWCFRCISNISIFWRLGIFVHQHLHFGGFGLVFDGL